MVEDKMGIKDDLGQMSEEAYKVSLERELEMFKDNLDRLEKTEIRYTKQVERQRKLWFIMLSDYELANEDKARMLFELNPEFWDIQREEQQDKIDQEEAQIKGTLKKFISDKAVIKEQIAEKELRLKELGE